MKFLQFLVTLVIYLVAVKAIIGFHFPWERCDCPNCGRRFDEHKPKIKIT